MGLTAFSFILWPLSAVWIMSPVKLIRLMVVVSIFEAAAALTLGGFGVQPGLVPALAFIGFILLQLLLGASYVGMAPAWKILRPFGFVVLWALVSSYVMPRVFQGQVRVWPQKADFPYVLTLLEPTLSNLNQDFYLAINAVFMFLCAAYLPSSGLSLLPLLRTYLWSGYLAAFVSVWQFASLVAGVPYPEDLFYSNPGWAILTGQEIGSAVPRINGPFSEPAGLGSYMAAMVCTTGALLLGGRRDRLTIVLFGVSLATIALSTSTTGFAVLALVSGGVPLYGVLTGSTRTLGSMLKIGVPLLLVGGALAFTAGTLIPGLGEKANTVLSATLNKQESSSYEDRTTTDIDSLTIALETGGIGVGWGSNRSSSLIPGLLATVGVPGLVGLLWFGIKLTGEVKKAHRLTRSSDDHALMQGCCGGIVGYLLGAMIAGPTISSMTFYFLIGLLVACVVRIKFTATRELQLLSRRTAPGDRAIANYPATSCSPSPSIG